MEPPDRKKQMLIGIAGAAVALVFLGIMFWTIFKDFHLAQPNGSHGSNAPLFIFGGFFLVMALAVVLSVASGIRKLSKMDSASPPPREDKPWLKRADWAAGKIKSTAGAQTKMFAIMAVAFCGMGGLFTFTALPKELAKGNHAALLVLIFPAIGIGFVIAIVRAVRAHRRFGNCFFDLAQVPVPLGGTLTGMIQTGARLRLEHGLHLKLSCIRRVVTGSGKNQSTQETVLWQDEKVFAPDASLPEPEPGHSGIPVFFKVPAGQPECFAQRRESVSWRLEAKAKMAGPDFAATFDVPVFQAAGAAVAETADEPDPTAALQMPVDELRRDENSKIQITDSPAGREFYFPAARNLGMVLGITGFFLMWSVILYFILHAKNCPRLFPIAFGLVDFFLFWACFNLWLKSSRVTVNPTQVIAISRWLVFSRTRKFDASDIARFELKTGMTSGTQTFQDIKLITNDCAEDFATRKARYPQTGERGAVKFKLGNPTVAGGLASKPEADWLVREMTKALGRR